MTIPLAGYLGLGLWMFVIGTVGVMIRRNPIVIFMCIELMLNAVNLTFLAFARYGAVSPNLQHGGNLQSSMAGQMIVIFVMAVAAAEVAVGLGIIMAIFRLRHSIDIDEMSVLRG